MATLYRRIGNLLVPDRAPARRLYWSDLHALQRLPRRSRLQRWRPGPTQALAWAAEAEAELAAWLGARPCCIWRPAEPGLARAALAWVYLDGRLHAMARWAEGDHCAFLRREWRALQYLATAPGLAASTPRLIRAEQWETGRGPRLLLVESALAGAPQPPRRELTPPLEAAAWLARFQLAAGARARWSGERLGAAIAACAGLSPAARTRLQARLAATPPAPAVAAHSDFWWGNVLLAGAPDPSIAVVDWSEFRLDAHPFHDSGFYLLTWGRDWARRGRRLAPAQWLEHVLAPSSPFRPLAETWWSHSSGALAGAGSERDLAALWRHLPLVMAHYACFGQQAAAWTAACNAWAAHGCMLAP